MASVSVDVALQRFKALVAAVAPGDRKAFRDQVAHHLITTQQGSCGGDHHHHHHDEDHHDESQAILQSIQEDLRKALPPDALLPGEAITYPTGGEFEGYAPHNTQHVDAFLYDEDRLDAMCDEGLLHRNYCTSAACGYSRDVQPLNFISHSLSVPQLGFMFDTMLTSTELSGACILDVGSRLGCVLYYAALFTQVPTVEGIERNEAFIDLQKKMIAKLPGPAAARVNLLAGDVFSDSGREACGRATVAVLNNVFEWFSDAGGGEDGGQLKYFSALRGMFKEGTVLITSPSIEDSLGDAVGPLVDGWLEEVKVEYPSTPGVAEGEEEPDDDFASFHALHKYRVVGRHVSS